MVTTEDLAGVLRTALPPLYQPRAPELAHYLTRLLAHPRLGAVDQPLDSENASALRSLVGRELAFGEAMFVIGENAQIGDISIGDIIRGDKISISLMVPPPPHASPALEQPRAARQLVGREDDLTYYRERLAATNLAVIYGMVGLGKTSVASALALESADQEHLCWVTVRSNQSFRELVLGLAEFLHARGRPELKEQLAHSLATTNSVGAVGVRINQLAQHFAGRGYLLVLDDYQEGADDKDVQQLTLRLRELADAGDLRVIITSWDRPNFVRADEFRPLPGLSEAAVRELLAAQGAPPHLARSLLKATGGAALFVNQAAIVLARADDPQAKLRELYNDEDIKAQLAREMYDALNEAERKVMQAVALLHGHPGSRDAIEYILDADGIPGLPDVVEELAGLNLLMATTAPEGPRYEQHPTIRGYCYERIGLRRLKLHARAAEFYEEFEPDSWLAALHYAGARKYDRAARLAVADVWGTVLRGSAADLLRVLESVAAHRDVVEPAVWPEVLVGLGRVERVAGVNGKAAQHFVAAFDAFSQLGQGAGVARAQATICSFLARTLQYDSPVEALNWIERGLGLLGDNPHGELAADFAMSRGLILQKQGRFVEARTTIEQGLNGLPPGISALRLDALTTLSAIQNTQGHFREAVTTIRTALDAFGDRGDPVRRLALLGNLAIALYSSGDWVTARQAFADSAELAEQVGTVAQRIRAAFNAGLVALNAGEDTEAEQTIEAALALAKAQGMREFIIACLSGLADLRLRTGRLATVPELVGEAERLIAETGLEAYRRTELRRFSAEYALYTGDLDGAYRAADEAHRLACELGHAVAEGQSIRVRAQIRVAAGDLAGAQDDFARSTALLMEDEYELARTRLCWGEALRAEGHHAAAGALIQQAEATFTHFGARRELAQARQLLLA